MAADFAELIHALKALEPKPGTAEHVCDGGWACHFHDVQIAALQPRVVIERNPLDFCGECQAEDEFGDFQITYRNGHEIALCRDCK
jgi:hypothetical protein